MVSGYFIYIDICARACVSKCVCVRVCVSVCVCGCCLCESFVAVPVCPITRAAAGFCVVF